MLRQRLARKNQHLPPDVLRRRLGQWASFLQSVRNESQESFCTSYICEYSDLEAMKWHVCSVDLTRLSPHHQVWRIGFATHAWSIWRANCMMRDASRNMWIEVILGAEGVELSPACFSPLNLFASLTIRSYDSSRKEIRAINVILKINFLVFMKSPYVY